MVRSRLQHHVCLGDSIDERACIDLLRAHRVVVSIETGEAIQHCFLCGIFGGSESVASLSRLLSPECVSVNDQRLINFAVMTGPNPRPGRWYSAIQIGIAAVVVGFRRDRGAALKRNGPTALREGPS